MVEKSQGMYRAREEVGSTLKKQQSEKIDIKEEYSKKANMKCPKTEEGRVESQGNEDASVLVRTEWSIKKKLKLKNKNSDQQC